MLRTYFQENFYDMPVEIAQKYAEGIRVAIMAGKDFDGEKKKGYYISKNRGFDDKLYIGNIERIENHLRWNGEELADDDQIVNVVMLDGPVTRDGDGCSYGSKDHRDQIMYANTIPQVVGHLFIINTPGGAASARIDYEQAIADCREKGKATVAWVDGMCCSAGQLVAALCDRTIVMNGRHTMGCIGTMCAFWGVANGTVDRDGFRYIELVSVTSPDKNAEYREACDGKTEKLQAELDKLGEEFRETVRQNRPLVKEEHLTGKTFDADEVMGALVDEIGDYSRAVQAVFDLAGKTLTAARFSTSEQEDKPAGEQGEEQEDMATLNEQQKGAIASSKGDLRMVEDGHVTTDKPGFFGPETVELATPKNDKNMTDEEKKAQEAEAAAAAAQEKAPATEQHAEEAPASDAAGDENGKPADEEGKPANEEGKPADEEGKPADEEGKPADEEGKPADEEGKPADENGKPANTPVNEEASQDAQAEINKITETLHNAEQTIEDKDKEIAELKKSLATLNGIAEERDAAVKERDELTAKYDVQAETLTAANAMLAQKDAIIENQKKEIDFQKKMLADKEAEIKELAGSAAPMNAGVPAGNGTGKAPESNGFKSEISSDMSPEEIRQRLRSQDEKSKTYRH